MIAYLATTTPRGRLLARQLHGLLPDARESKRRLLFRRDRPGLATGFIATREAHLVGQKLTGVILLEPVALDLAATAAARIIAQRKAA